MKHKLTIVVVSYNTKNLLKDCINSLIKVKDEVDYQVIIIDNASSDNSQAVVRKFQIPNSKFQIKLIENKENLGFGKANNQAKKYSDSKYVLFLNSDTIVHKNTLKKTVRYLDEYKDVGSVTCKTILPNGKLDKDVRRSFPTPWVAFTHIALPLDRIFPKSRLFGKYWYGYISEDTKHEIDVVQGAFHLTRKKILDEVGWFDEEYFLDGEDIDLCWRIKQRGWKIVYYPKVSITHIKKASKKNHNHDKKMRRRIISAGVDSMEMFYKKHLWDKYPKILNLLIVAGIRLVKFLRILKLHLT